MLTVSLLKAKQLNERRKLSGAMLVDKLQLMASVQFDTVFALYSRLWCSFYGSELSPHLSLASTTKQTVNFTFDSATYFLFLVRELASYQDEGKCQDGGSAARRPAGCQVCTVSVNWSCLCYLYFMVFNKRHIRLKRHKKEKRKTHFV